MANVFLELERLRAALRSKGYDENTVSSLVDKAEIEIESQMQDRMQAAMDKAIEAGVTKQSPEFINELRPMPNAFRLETESHNMDFSTPPYPMLDKLLSNAKPMADGSGVYKVIPVGTPGKKPSIANNIFDAQKQIATERYEAAVAQYNKIKPSASKANFKTATSKQSRDTSWVIPAKEKDFTQDLSDINNTLETEAEDIIERVVRSYEDGF
jgi:hypothetical protein